MYTCVKLFSGEKAYVEKYVEGFNCKAHEWRSRKIDRGSIQQNHIYSSPIKIIRVIKFARNLRGALETFFVRILRDFPREF